MSTIRWVGPEKDGTFTLRLPCTKTWVEELDDYGPQAKQCQEERRYTLTANELNEFVERGTGKWMDDWAKDENRLCEIHQEA